MSVRLYDDLNPDWEEPPGWEPWEDEDGPEFDQVGDVGCAYCPSLDVRDHPEPFGGKPCCDACFNIIIGGSEDDPPWRCGGTNPFADGPAPTDDQLAAHMQANTDWTAP